MTIFPRPRSGLVRRSVLAGALIALGASAAPALADEPQLAPQTRIRVTIVQWVPAKSEYEQWGALGGEFAVSDAGAVTLPVIGSVPVGKLSAAELASDISSRLKTAIGLSEMPATTVEIIEYPPIYVVGDVAKPGEYKFHTGLTVLQALAMGGGEMRPTTPLQHSQVLGTVGELQAAEKSILRSGAKISRLQAELTGAKEISFDQPAGPQDELTSAVYNQERIIFDARANELDRQSKSLTELRDLINAEIENIGEKAKGIDENIKSTEGQLDVAKSLVERGIATTSRQIDLERMLTGYRSDRLDLTTAAMRARQNIAETTRNLSALFDRRHTEVASDLRSEQDTLDQLKLKRDTLQKQLLDALQSGDAASYGQASPPSFAITRQTEGKIDQFPATETTGLMPGDVVTVVRARPQAAELPSAADAPPDLSALPSLQPQTSAANMP